MSNDIHSNDTYSIGHRPSDVLDTFSLDTPDISQDDILKIVAHVDKRTNTLRTNSRGMLTARSSNNLRRASYAMLASALVLIPYFLFVRGAEPTATHNEEVAPTVNVGNDGRSVVTSIPTTLAPQDDAVEQHHASTVRYASGEPRKIEPLVFQSKEISKDK